MAKFTVSEFSIEVGFTDKVTEGLRKLEQSVNAASIRMENRLSKTFDKDYTKKLHQSLQRLDSAAYKTSQNINRNLTNAFNARVNGRVMFGDVVKQANFAAKEANRVLKNVGRGFNDRVGGGTGGNGGRRRGGGTGPGGHPDPEHFDNSEHMRLYQRFAGSAQMRRLEMSGGRNTMFAREMQSRAANAMVRYQGDTENLRRAFALLSVQVREHSAAVRRDTTATNGHRDAERRTGRGAGTGEGNRSLLSRLNPGRGTGAGGVALGMLAANAVTFAAHKAIDFAHEAYEQGKERAQSKVMLETAVGEAEAPAMQKKLNEQADKYGIDYTENTKEFAGMRAVFGKDHMSNDQLLKMMENESVFAHSSGLNNEQVAGANRQLSQIAGGSKVMKSDLNALGNNIPEWARVVGKGLGKDAEWVKKNYQKLTPRQFMDAWQKGLQELNDQSGAALKAQKSIQAQEGRLKNAWNNDLVAMFQGTGDNVGNLFDTLTSILKDAEPIFRGAGEAVGGFLHTLDDAYKRTDFKAIGTAFENLFNALPKDVQDKMSEIWHQLFDDPFKGLPEAAKEFTDFINQITGAIKVLTGQGNEQENQEHDIAHNVHQAVKSVGLLPGDTGEGFQKPAARPEMTPEQKAFALGINGRVLDVSQSHEMARLGKEAAAAQQQKLQIENKLKVDDATFRVVLDNGGIEQLIDFKLIQHGDRLSVQASNAGGWNKPQTEFKSPSPFPVQPAQ